MLPERFFVILKNIDWILFGAIMVIAIFGLVTMNSFTDQGHFFGHQIVWLAVSLTVFFVASVIDWSFLKNTIVVVTLFAIAVFLLGGLFILGSIFKGATSWFSFGILSFQPTDPAKLIVILVLAKYFSRRHIEIKNIRHIIVSGLYVSAIFILVFMQPALGSAIIIFCIWLGMVLISGISTKHLAAVFLLGLAVFGGLWFFGLKQYQKDRIKIFIHPLTSVRSSGYNAYQSMIAVGSGEILGKGIGYGSQSKLQFLPEYQTDFIFAAFAEEWGFIGSMILLMLYGIILYRCISISSRGATNFEILFGTGLTILLLVQIIIHVGTNIGLVPVTGNTLPFMSYGGSHLLTEFLGLGILMSMKQFSRVVHRQVGTNEMVGI